MIGVEVDIPGATNPNLSIGNVKLLTYPSGTYLGVELHNDGNLFLKPSGTLILNDSSGNQMLKQAIVMDTFVTNTNATYPVAWPGIVAPGKYTVAVELAYGEHKKSSYNGVIEISDETAGSATQPQGAQQPALAQQPAGSASGSAQILYAFFAGISLMIGVALVGFYIYRRKQRRHAERQRRNSQSVAAHYGSSTTKPFTDSWRQSIAGSRASEPAMLRRQMGIPNALRLKQGFTCASPEDIVDRN